MVRPMLCWDGSEALERSFQRGWGRRGSIRIQRVQSLRMRVYLLVVSTE